ncbi:MAG: MgtC/SapB family protein [Hyphomicrobium sp.]|jgi:putative Mg2+ transporter-C (MgtC) family protein
MPVSTFQDAKLANSIICLSAAFALGVLIGAERQYRNRSAGLRTHVLVAISAAAFVDLGGKLTDAAGAVHIAAYVVSGIGFLGAGAILRDGPNVRGLDTAATLWSSAAVGALSGAGFLAEAVVLTAFVIAGNTLLRPLVNGINHLPFNERSSGARYQVHIIADMEESADVRAHLRDALDTIEYPAREMRVYKSNAQSVEVIATLYASAVETRALDKLVEKFGKRPGIAHATWSHRILD